MALGKAMPVVVFAAALTCCFVPAQGVVELGTPKWPIATVGLNQNSNGGFQIATTEPNLPVNFDAGCSCKKLTHCSCEVSVVSNMMASRFEFHPQIHVEFIETNVSLRVTVKNQDKVLILREILGEDYIPPLCVPIPQFPTVQFCIQVKDLTSSIADKSAGLCLTVGVKTVGVSLPADLVPTVPIGCFSATLGKEIAFMPPEIQIPGLGSSKPVLGDKIAVPLNQGFVWPFTNAASFREQNKNDINSMNFAANPFLKLRPL